MYIEEAMDHGAELIDRAKVSKVIIEGKTAVGVEFKKNGQTSRLYAPKIVVSAGGIGTPVILRASGMKEAGYNFFMMPDMSHPFASSALFAAGAFRFDKLFSRRNTLQIMVKAKDELGGKLTDKGGIRKVLGQNEKQTLSKGYERAKEILKNAGAKGIFKTGYLAAHPGGTVKVGQLVDSNLKTEYENLYICDCSVIPEAWGLPPTSTIIAFGKRLAKYLLGKNRLEIR